MIRHVPWVLICLFFNGGSSCQDPPQSEKHEDASGIIDTCLQYYVRGNELARGATAIVYAVKECVGFSCPGRAVVKEVVGKDIVHNDALMQKAAELGIGPAQYKAGSCVRGDKDISFEISQRLEPANFNVIQAYPEEFKTQVTSMLDKLHQAGFTHGDIHIGNILYTGTETPRFYLTDFDKGVDLSKVSSDEAKSFIDYENARTQRLFEGEYYPEGGLPNYRSAWQPFVYKLKQFDLDHDGTLNASETQQLVDSLGSLTEGTALSALYQIRMSTQLTANQRSGLFADKNNDGELSKSEVLELAKLFPTLTETQLDDVRTAYNDYGKNMRTRFTSWNLPPGEREIAPGIKAGEVVIIAAGDTRPGRTFPLLTIPLFAEFAANHGYRFEHFNGNLAAPWVPYWNKIWMMLDRMEHPGNKVIVWFDDDGVVSTKSDMIEQYLQAYPNKDVIVSTDPEYWATLNTGVMIVRNNKASKELLLEVLRIGMEWRTVKEEKEYVKRKIQLVQCKQGYTCLHEQQALQELYLKIRRECEPSAWGRCPIIGSPRQTVKDFSQLIQVVPQIDPLTGRNMNLFFDPESPNKLAGRDYPDSRVKRPYRLNVEPFFIQPAGKGEHKHEAILQILKKRGKRV